MNRILFVATAMMLALSVSFNVNAQRNCGLGIRYHKLASDNPALWQQIKQQQLKATAEALAASGATASKTAASQSPIPLVFHFILTQAQYNSSGQDTGIIRRVNSQLKSLNNDFNGANADRSLIPGAFAGLYANVGIQFGLAKATNANTIAPGIERKILTTGTTYDVNEDCYTAKQATAIGFAAWDVNKYLNIWVVNVTNGTAPGFILGITTSPQTVGFTAGTHLITSDEKGIVLNYGAVGVREFPAPLQYFIANIDKGRTLTHEMGHYFELSHTWGDDNGLCPTNGGQDDGITDTPPEADATYCNFPKPSGSACPSFPTFDSCTKTGNGIMYMNYMDYVDDRAMMMFTNGQKAVMTYQVASSDRESWSLTQNPGLVSTGIATVSENAFFISPNPATSNIHINLNGKERLTSIDLVNMMGQRIAHVTPNGSTQYDIALDNAPRGIYFVQCHFAEGTLAKKIVLE